MASFLRPLKPGESRALAVLLLVVAIAAALVLLLLPMVLLHRHYDNAIATQQDHLERFRRVAAQAPAFKQALDTLRGRDGRSFYLTNTASNLAGAELQDIVRNAIESNGGRITTIQVVQPKDDGRYKQIDVSLQLFASTPNLQKILYALETQQPYLVVENLSLRPLNAFRNFKPAPGAEPEVSVQLEVAGFSRPEADKK
jgi:hypothetical protein